VHTEKSTLTKAADTNGKSGVYNLLILAEWEGAKNKKA